MFLAAMCKFSGVRNGELQLISRHTATGPPLPMITSYRYQTGGFEHLRLSRPRPLVVGAMCQ